MGFADTLIKNKKKFEEEYGQPQSNNFAESLIYNKQQETQNIANTVNTLNSVQPTIQTVEPTVEQKQPVKEETKEDKSFGFSIDNKKKTTKDYKKDRDESYDKLMAYKKEKGINLLNESKFKKDKTYQELLKDTQEKQQLYDDSKVEKNTKKLEKDLEEANPVLSAIARTGIALGSGATRGFEGIESSIRKATGQEQETQKYNFNEPMLQTAQEGANKGEQIAMNISQSIGQMVPQMMAPGSKSAMALGFANYGGSAYNDAKKQGATEEQATAYGIASGSLEMLMEKVLGGFENIYGKKLGKDFTGNVMSKLIKNKAVRDTLSGMKGEFTEEYLQEFLEPILKNIILKEDNGADFWNTMKDDFGAGLKQLGSQFFNQQNLVSGLYGAATSGMLEGPVNFANQSRINQVQQQQIQQPTEIPTQTQLQAPIQGVQQQNNQLMQKQQTPQITPLNQVNQELQETRQNDIANQVQAMNLQPEFTQKQKNYVYEKSDNAKIDNLRKDAANYLKEGEQTTNFVNTLEKLVKDKDIEIRFDNKLGNNVNGTYKDGVITINPNSNRAGEFVAIHELTHAIGTDSMINMIDKYRKSNAEFNQAVEKLLSTYKTNEINEEALGDIAGQLFGNQEYINNLSMENPSLFKKIYNEIKYLWHQFTGYKNQDQFIEDLKNKWESAYRNKKAKTNKIGYSINENFASEYDNWDKKERQGNFVLGKTSKPMQSIGLDNRNIVMDKSKILQIQNDHPEMTDEMIKQIPDILEDPVLILKSQSKANKNNNRIVVFGDVLDLNNNPVLVAMELNPDENNNANVEKIYKVASAYGKENRDTIQEWLNNEENILYKDPNQKRTTMWLDGLGLQLSVPSNSGSVDNNISQEEKNVKQELNNSSFNLDENAKRYGDLSKTKYIEYFTKDNGDVRINLMDSNNNLVNQFDLYNQREAIKELGEKLGKQIYQSSSVDNQRFDIGNDINNLGNENDYFMTHRPTESGITADDLTGQGKEFGLPDNIYEHPEYYSMNDKEILKETMDQLNKVRNNPDADITIYRATTGDKINKGDWVTLSKKYAEMHNESQLDGKGNIVEKTVKAKDVQNAGDVIEEWGYFPTTEKFSKDNQTWKEYLEKEFPSQGTRTDLGEVTGRKQQETLKTTTEKKTTQEQSKTEAKQEIKKQEYLTKAEQEELNDLRDIDNTGWIELTKEEKSRLEELEKKSKGITKKYPDLKTNNQFEDIKGIYGKYKDSQISRENNKVLNRAKNIIEANKQGRRTKEQWLQVAEFVGSNANIKNSQDLQQLAMETWFNEKPNNSSVLNRQGQKYVKFTPQDWVNAVYKGAGVGNETKLSKEQVQPKERNTINESTKDEVVTMSSKDITKALNDTKKGIVPDGKKMRSWVDTSNIATGNKETISKANIDAITYEVQSNKKTYEQAVANTKNLSYDEKVFKAKQKLNTNKKVTLTDLAEAQLALREAATKGDTKTYLDLQQDIAIMGTELGQMIQSLSLIQKLSPDGQLLMLQKTVNRQQKLGNKSWDGVEFDEKLVQKVLDSYDDTSHTTFNKEKLDQAMDDLKQNLADQMKVSVSDKVNEWRYLSMLGNPKTHIRNIVANVAMTTTKRIKETLNASMQDLLIRDPSKKTATLKKATQEVKDLSKIAYEETFEVNKGNKYNEKNEIESKKKVFNNKIIENFRKLNAKALDLEDQAFKKIEFERAFSNYLAAQNIKTTQDINNNPKIIQQAKAFALEESKIATFQQENEFANWINKLDRKGPIAKVVRGAVIPFTRTPLNIAKTGLEYAPGTGLLTTIADVKKAPDNMKGNVAINGISKQITGTSLAMLGYALAKSGILKSTEDDDKEGKFKKDQGLSMDFSIKIGDKFYDLSWLSPSSMPLFVGASMFEQLEKKDKIDGNVIMEGIANTLDPLSEMSCISSFTDVLQSFQRGSSKMISQMGQKTAQNYISQFVPTVSSQFARLFDTKKRTTNADKTSGFTWGQETQRQLMYKIPGLRNLLPEQTDYFGETKKEEQNILIRGLEAFLSPANSKKDISNKEAKELIKVYDETGDNDVLPSSLNKYLKYDGEKLNMTTKEWNQYKKDFGTTLKESLKETMATDEYKNANSTNKADIISGLMKYSKDKAKDNYLNSKDIDYSYYSDSVDAKRESDYSLAEYYIIKNEEPKVFNGSVDTVRKKIDTANDIGISVVDYYNLKQATNEFKADKNEKGKSISGSKKTKVVNYINSRDDLTEEQKNKFLSSLYKKW